MEQRHEKKVIKLKNLKLSRLKKIYASAFSRNENYALLNKPEVELEYNNEQYTIGCRGVMYSFLKYLDTDWDKQTHENAMVVIGLHEVLNDFLEEYKMKSVLCWVNQDNRIVGIAERMDYLIEHTNIEGVYAYIENKLWSGAGRTVRQSFLQGGLPHFRVTNGNMNLEIVLNEPHVIVRGRYDVGEGYVQVVKPKKFKGSIDTIRAKELYGAIDAAIEKLIHVDKNMIWNDTQVRAVCDTSNMKTKEVDTLEWNWFCWITGERIN